MIAPVQKHTQWELIERINRVEREHLERAKDREPSSSYASGQTGRNNPVPPGIDPLGSDADYHYRTERNYFLHVERGRAAVRNNPLVEQGVNCLVANMRIGHFILDVDSGDKAVDADQKADWLAWCEDAHRCDYERRRTFAQLARQSFFSQVTDGDILHLPLRDGSLQTWESHHLRSPWGTRQVSGTSLDGIVHGVEIENGQTVAYHITPRILGPAQSSRRGESRRFDAYDPQGNRIVFWLGFTHRFRQRRGISRLSAPRDAMTGFDDLNYAHTKSALRRALISFFMAQATSQQLALPTQGAGKLPQTGPRAEVAAPGTPRGMGVETMIIEQMGEPAQVIKAPDGYKMDGWNANIPGSAFFEHAQLMLTMLSVNLNIPLMFLLMDGSLVNFHGGRMTFDQMKLRLAPLIQDQIDGLYNPTYEWHTRQRLTPGSRLFDAALFRAVQRGQANPFRFKFRPMGWPYIKPLEDAAAEDLAERRNLRSMKAILADRAIDEDEHYEEICAGRGKFIRRAIAEAVAIQRAFPQVVSEEELPKLWREIRYGNEQTGAQLAISADTASGEVVASADAGKKSDSKKPAEQGATT